MPRIETKILSDQETLEAVYSGAKLLYDAVGVTLGPTGKNVLFQKLHKKPGLTHDGVTVAQLVSSNDPAEQVALEIMREAALKQDSVIGDGTTTVTVLTYAVLNEAIAAMRGMGINPMVLKRELDALLPSLIKDIEALVEKDVDLETTINVATVAAGDKEIGKTVGEVVFEAGANTPILLNFSDSDETYAETIRGIRLEGGPASPYLLQESKETIANPFIFVVDAKLRQRDDVLPLLRTMSQFPEDQRNFLVICNDIAGDALSYMVANKVNGFANIAVSRVSSEIKNKSVYLSDIALMCNATVIAPNTPNNLRDHSADCAGRAKEVIVSLTDTIIVEGQGVEEDVAGRREELATAHKEAKTKGERSFLKERLKMLEQKVISIYVGGKSASDAEERHYRFEDAVGAARAALYGGVVPGGGTLLFHVGETMKQDTTAEKVVSAALKLPLRKVMSNAGIDISEHEISLGKGINVLKPENGVVDLWEEGIIDPAKSEIESVKTAVTVAGLLITSGALIVDMEVHDEAE